MLDYINEMPEKLLELIDANQIDELLNKIQVNNLKRIIFVASGSSYNIGLITKKIFETYAKISVENYIPYEFLITPLEKYSKEDTLVIAISQTGTSKGTIDSIKYAKTYCLKVLSITERKNTEVSILGDYYLNFLCGFEDSNAKTKGYTNSLTLLFLFAINISKKKQTIPINIYYEFIDELRKVAIMIPNTIKDTLDFLKSNKSWATIDHLFVIGYGINYGTAIEGMLKIVETLCIPGSVTNIGEFPHGFHRAISYKSNIILINTEEYGKEISDITIDYLKNKVNKFLVINATKTSLYNDYTINVGYLKLTSSSLLISVVFQVIAAYLPAIIGYNPNRNSNNEYAELVNTRQ